MWLAVRRRIELNNVVGEMRRSESVIGSLSWLDCQVLTSNWRSG